MFLQTNDHCASKQLQKQIPKKCRSFLIVPRLGGWGPGLDDKRKIQTFEILTSSLFKQHVFIFFSYSDPRQWIATFGTSTTSPQQRVAVRSILIHDNYNPETHENDIALVQLDKEVTFNRYIHTVCLPEANQAISTGSTAYVTGWGSQSYSGKSLRKNKNKDNSNISWYLPLCTFFLIKGHLKGRFYRENHPTV